MDQESGFHPAERQVDHISFISPRISDRSEAGNRQGVIFSAGEATDDSGEAESSGTVDVDGEASENEDVEEARVPRTPHNPGKPTKKEMEDHLPLHWPFRSRCRHCVLGRAVSSPHKARTETDR